MFSTRPGQVRRFQPRLEALEDRWLPAPVAGTPAPAMNAAVVASNQAAAATDLYQVIGRNNAGMTLRHVEAFRNNKPYRFGRPFVVARTDETNWLINAARGTDLLKAVPVGGGEVMYEFTNPKRLSYELAKAPKAATREGRVEAWLKQNRETINQVAKQANVPPEAIAGAIAWEALQNVQVKGKILWGLAGLGPGKIHPEDNNAAQQIEEDVPQLLPGQGMGIPKIGPGARLVRLWDAWWAIRYTGAIMKSYADKYDEVNPNSPTPLRADAAVLATLFQGVSTEKTNIPDAQHYNQNPLGGLLGFPTDKTAIRPNNAKAFFEYKKAHNLPLQPNGQMGAWVKVHAQWLKKAVELPAPTPTPTPTPAPTPTPVTPTKPSREHLSALWDAVSTTKNSLGAPWLSRWFGTGTDATAWLLRPKDGVNRADAGAWGKLALARDLIKAAVVLYDAARVTPGKAGLELNHQANAKIAQASPLVKSAEDTWAALWAQSLQRT